VLPYLAILPRRETERSAVSNAALKKERLCRQSKGKLNALVFRGGGRFCFW
jgi:hypothetical protein